MKMNGIYLIGFKLLVNDKGKFTALLMGITFSVFLMVQMTSMFAGIMNHAYANVTNIGAEMWVMDPAVNMGSSSIPMPDSLLNAVKSIDGVSYAVPLFLGSAQAKLSSGSYQSVTIIGLDDATLFGRPIMQEGELSNIFAENAFLVVKDDEYTKLGSPRVGDSFELNDNRATIVGIAKAAANGLNGVPTLYTTYKKAIEYIPTTRFTISFVLVKPKSVQDIAHIKSEVQKLGYVARTKAEFNEVISNFYIFKTGIGINLLLMTIISFIIGLSISGQTFYTFILENLEKFCALKAIGAKSSQLIEMILFMATFTALTGYGLGIGLVTLMIFYARSHIAGYAAVTTNWNLGLAFAMVVVIAALSSVFGIRRVLKIEPFDIFRG